MAEISIVTVSKNAERWLPSCMQTVAEQTVSAEHILVDGASTDRTLELAQSGPGHFSRVVSERDRGIYDAMNKGIGLASARVVGLLNTDDRYADAQVLENVLKVFSDSAVMACYGDLEYIDPARGDKIVRRWRAGEFNRQKFFQGWMMPHPTLFLRRSVYEEFGLFRTDLGSSADYELMIRLFVKHGLSASYIPRLLVRMRLGGASNASTGARWRANKNDARAWRLNDIQPRPWTTLAKPLRKITQWRI